MKQKEIPSALIAALEEASIAVIDTSSHEYGVYLTTANGYSYTYDGKYSYEKLMALIESNKSNPIIKRAINLNSQMEATKNILIERFNRDSDLIRFTAKSIISNMNEESGYALVKELHSFLLSVLKKGCSSGVPPGMEHIDPYVFFDTHGADILELINKGEIIMKYSPLTYAPISTVDIKTKLSWRAYVDVACFMLDSMEYYFRYYETRL